MEEGASIPTAGSSAWHALFTVGGLKAGESVLVHAGAGGVGTFAIQFAKKLGAHVLAIASGSGLDLARSLGAYKVVDYRKQDFTEAFSDVDLVIDLVGGDTQSRSYAVLKRGGRLVSLTAPPSESAAAEHGVTASLMFAKPYMPRLSEVVDAVAEHGVKPVVGERHAFADFARALQDQASGRARGKIVVTHA